MFLFAVTRERVTDKYLEALKEIAKFLFAVTRERVTDTPGSQAAAPAGFYSLLRESGSLTGILPGAR